MALLFKIAVIFYGLEYIPMLFQRIRAVNVLHKKMQVPLHNKQAATLQTPQQHQQVKAVNSSQNQWQQLPDDIWVSIMTYLPAKDITHMELVSSQMRDVAINGEDIWKSLFATLLAQSTIKHANVSAMTRQLMSNKYYPYITPTQYKRIFVDEYTFVKRMQETSLQSDYRLGLHSLVDDVYYYAKRDFGIFNALLPLYVSVVIVTLINTSLLFRCLCSAYLTPLCYLL